MGEGYRQPRSVLSGRLLRAYKEYRWPNGNLKYECFHNDINAALTDTKWEVRKWSSSGEDWEGFLFGAANSEAVLNALPWNRI